MAIHYVIATNFSCLSKKTGHTPLICSTSPSSYNSEYLATTAWSEPFWNYNTRSKCSKESRPCTPQCHCINCANPHGQQLHIPNIHERTRRKHKLQEKIPSSKHFAQERGEKLSEAVWFTFELHEVCALLKKADIHIITKTYTDIVSYCISLFCIATLPKVVFRSKTVSQVQSKIMKVIPSL